MEERTRPLFTLIDGGAGADGPAPVRRPPELIWRRGMAWRDLTADIALAGCPVVAVSAAGTVRMLDVNGRWQARFRPGGTVLDDGVSCVLSQLVSASPCGIVTWGDPAHPDAWSASTPLDLVYAGRPDDAGVFETAGPPWRVPVGHILGPCGALHCPRQVRRWEPPTPSAAGVHDG